MNLGTLIIGLAVLAMIAGAIVKLLKDKKKGKSACGCGCACCDMKDKCK